MTKEHSYRSYLLRLWPAKMDGETWRASLECVQTKERHGFDDLEALFTFLRQETGHRADALPPEDKKA